MITAEELRSLYSYSPETGDFIRLTSAYMNPAGSIAGTFDKDGYRQISIGPRKATKIYKSHRLAWLYMTGEWPKGHIDHINGNPSDNRWCNLREATPTQNVANAKRRKDNTSGFKGVCWYRKTKKWKAEIMISQKHIHLGYFDTPELAHQAYVDAAIKYFGEFARAA